MQQSNEPAALLTMFSPLPGSGASARSLYALARLMRRWMHIDVIAPRRRGQRYTESNGEGRVYRVPLGGVDYGPDAEGRFLRAVQRQLRAQPYDVVVAGDPLSVLAARHAGVDDLKIVYCLRELRSAELTDFGPRLRQALGVADKIVLPTEAARDALITSGLEASRLEVVPPYLELRSLIATERHPFRQRLVLLGVDRPQRLVSVSAQLLDALPAEWSLIVPSDGGQTREELKMLGEGSEPTRLQLPLAWPPQRWGRHLARGGVALVFERDEANMELDLPCGDRLLARAAGLPVVVVPDDGTAADILEAVGEHEQTDSPEPSDLGTWPRLADLLAQWAGIMGVTPELLDEAVSDEATASDSYRGSGTATRTDWVETDLSRADSTSSSYELSQNTGVHSD
ncbi:MAG: glycosyltransferase [Myxococcota bacterium]|nr:glycosyltransferase [Myxococcota bacterium]